MLKYTDVLVSFSEVPDQISLCINISGCTNACKNCHSPWLAKDEGKELNYWEIKKLIEGNRGVTCICIMGGDRDPRMINSLATIIKSEYDIYVGWYSGKQYIPDELDLTNFDYVKIGPYIEELGPLTSRTTNQIMYQVIDGKLNDITYRFWK